MHSISTWTRRAAVAVSLLAAPAVAEAQFQRGLTLCNVPQQFCASVGLSLSGNTLQVGIANAGSTPSADSFISGFGIYGGGITGGTLVDAETNFVGSPANTLAFATNGAPNDLQNGAGTQTTPIGSDFGNSGFRPCGFGDALQNNQTRLETCAGEYGLFTFNLIGSSFDLNTIQIGLRAQNLQLINGATQTSDKCFSTGDANCQSTPGGGLSGSVVPEPSTYVLLGTGMLGLMGVARRRRQS